MKKYLHNLIKFLVLWILGVKLEWNLLLIRMQLFEYILIKIKFKVHLLENYLIWKD